MSVEVAAQNRDVLAAARGRVRVGPVPDWVVPCSYAPDFKTKCPAAVTHLLIDRQLNAELHETFVRSAIRLETRQGVQHESQWRLEFSPQTQSIDLHSIQIRRGSDEIEHAGLDRIQFLQRESGLEGFVIDGWVTLLLLIEDVRPGDVLECAYTIASCSRLIPESCAALFTIPEKVHFGKHHLSVRFAETQQLKWKSSGVEFTPVEKRENGVVHWTWGRENFECPEREPGTPTWYIAQPWIQVSDWPDWQSVATAFWNAWKEDGGEGLATQVQQIAEGETDTVRRVERALRLVQDDFRYLSVNLELGGQVPACPETVIRRRYGDCKDLAFLLVQLLRRLGVKARAVLVNTMLRHSIKNMLPSPGLFNHAVVEYQLGDETRWIDATIKGQGGGALNRVIPNYGLGLPIDPTSLQLTPPPAGSSPHGGYELKECFLVDTTGDASYLSVTLTAKGFYAENLRLQFENEGLESIAENRLKACGQRFPQAKRVNSMQYRDDREANQFVVAEIFEINGFLVVDGALGVCWFQLPNNALSGILPLYGPQQPQRRSPLELLYPCKIVHIIEIESLGLEVAALPAYRLKNDFFEFSCTARGVRKFTTATFTLTTLAEAIPPERISEYQKQVEKVMPLSLLRVRLPVGYARIRRRSDFGALPAKTKMNAPSGDPRGASALSGKDSSRSAPSPKIAMINSLPQEQTAKARADLEKVVLTDAPPSRRRHSRRGRRRSEGRLSNPQRKREFMWILAFVAAGLALIGFLFLMSLAGAHSR